MPGANELSTVEWHKAQVMPTRVSVSAPLIVPTVPYTDHGVELQQCNGCGRACQTNAPSWMPCTTADGNASESTFSPTDNAVTGSTAARITCASAAHRSTSSHPEVSKRNICLPCCNQPGQRGGERPATLIASATPWVSLIPEWRVALQVTSPGSEAVGVNAALRLFVS
jgi:hypothetical protein